MKKRVLVLAELPGEAVNRLATDLDVEILPGGVGSEEELAGLLPGVSGLITLLTHPVGLIALGAADRLEIVANYAVGVDNIDFAEASRRQIVVTNTPDVLTEDTADLAWSLLLAVSRRVVEGDHLVRRGGFVGWQPQLLLGRCLAGKTLGVVGAGRIGQAVLGRARAFGMRGVYNSRTRLSLAQEEALGVQWQNLDDLLAASDFVSLHLPLTAQSRSLFDAKRLARMKEGSYLINTARGPIVDEKALSQAVSAGHLAGAGLDVFEREPEVESALLALPNVVLTPHIGSATIETRTRMAEICCADVRAVLVEGKRPERAL